MSAYRTHHRVCLVTPELKLVQQKASSFVFILLSVIFLFYPAFRVYSCDENLTQNSYNLEPLKRSVIGILVRPDGKKLVLRRGPTAPAFPGFWCFPGGTINQGESEEQALVREAEEEVGLKVTIVKKIGEFSSEFVSNKAAKIRYKISAFLIQALEETVTLSYEHDAFDWVDPLEASRLLPVGEVTLRILQMSDLY